ncbi:hypothetical protein, partial [Yersinia similis]|uniref:hypothetical protein n=1 Tax=Yersinia similis TaxID=367190 RepID=UPI001E2FFCFA
LNYLIRCVPSRWMRIIGSSTQPATAIFNKNDCLLHSTAKPRFIRSCTQTYPQIESALKIDEHHAIVFATIPRVEKGDLIDKISTK